MCAAGPTPIDALLPAAPVRASTLRIMARIDSLIDALYLEDPRSGSRRMVEYLAREGIPISCDQV